MYLHSSCSPSLLPHSVSVFFSHLLYHVVPTSCFCISPFSIIFIQFPFTSLFIIHGFIFREFSLPLQGTPSYIFSFVLPYRSWPHCLPKTIIIHHLHILQTTPSSCLSDSPRATSTPTASQKIKTSNNYDEELHNHKQFVHNNG